MKTEEKNTVPHWPPAKAIDTFIRLILLGGLLAWCILILAPFTSVLMWSVILAVALYPVFATMARWMGGRLGWAATVIVVVGVSCVAVPGYITGKSLVDSVGTLRAHLGGDELKVPQLPAEWYQDTGLRRMVADRWPADNGAVAEFLQAHLEDIKEIAKSTLQAFARFTADLVMLILSIVIAGVLLANAKAGGKVAETFLDRVMGRDGSAMVDLAASTIRQVAKGILGVAVLQAAMFAAGVFIAGIPGAGLLTVVALILCIIQLGVLIVAIPVLIYAWTSMGTTAAVILTIWMVITMISDNILKPLLLGRGASVPMPVIFLGAIGGFILSGFIGLFTGAVVLSIGYRLMNSWMTGIPEVDQASATAGKA
jgi:predicted PurR-regulated permease PerM